MYRIYIFNATINTKISSSDACDIFPRVVYFSLVQLMVVLINLNVPIILVLQIIDLLQIVFAVLLHQMMNISSRAMSCFQTCKKLKINNK